MEGDRALLVVDDNAVNRLVLQMMLEAAGYDVVEAADGVEAVETAQAHRPPVVLMDIMMPRMNGIEAASSILADRTAPRPGMIAVTGSTTEAQRRACAEAGFDAFLAKPVDQGRLLALVARMLAERSEPPASASRAARR